jgi:hypothetical protein
VIVSNKPNIKRRSCVAFALICAIELIVGCQSPHTQPVAHSPQPAEVAQAQFSPPSEFDQPRQFAQAPLANALNLQAVDINDPVRPSPLDGPLELAAARNEWTSFALQISNLPKPDGKTAIILRLQPLCFAATNQTIGPANISVYQILPMPVNTDKAGYVRQTGLATGAKQLPRALVPVPMDGTAVNISALRDPAHPFDPSSRPGPLSDPLLLWIDIHIPKEAKSGIYSATADLMATGRALPISQVQQSLQVFDFVVPDERHLQMVSQIDWTSLQRLYPDQFEAITPRLMNRKDSTYAAPIHILDQLISLARQNRTELVVPRLQPTVKWPSGQTPQVDWSDFDSVVTPWLSGAAFADKSPLGYWPLPWIDYLSNFDAKSQQDYWSNAAGHFNRQEWLSHSGVFIDQPTAGRATEAQSVELSQLAQRVLAAHPLLRVTVPLEDDQLQFATAQNAAQNPNLLDPAATDRIMSAATGLVFAAPTQPVLHEPSQHWLRTDLPGLVPYVGAGGDERDVRLWAWLAYLKRAQMIYWSNALPRQNQPAQEADPNEMVWFYPGQWFGLDQPVPSIQLKWLRRAQQDFEYLNLAAQRGMPANALMLARLMTKQVQIQPGQIPDPEYALLTGTVEQKTWDQAQSLLARTILLRQPGQKPDDPSVKSREITLNLDTIRWQQPKERPFILPRTAQWLWDKSAAPDGDKWAVVQLGVDIYNAGDNRPDQNRLQWTSAGEGWEFRPQPVVVGALQTYWVQRLALDARLDLDHISAQTRGKPLEITFVDGYTRNEYRMAAILPAAVSQRREGGLAIDGKVNDWAPEDLIHEGKLTRMLDRPTIQQWRVEPATQSSQIFTGWSDENFYVAFRLSGWSKEEQPHRNFVDFEFRRAWGEDLCEVMVQPIYDDNTLGPITYLAAKPNGVCMVRRRIDVNGTLSPWREIDGTSVRYAADPQKENWTGEIAIPWDLLIDNRLTHARPQLLRFNFIQHMESNGETDSWAGPMDFDQDDSYMGLLYLKDLTAPGMKGMGR